MRVASARRAVCLAVVLLAAFAEPAHGGTGTLLSLPIGPKPTVRGLKLLVDTRWAQGYGYRPVRIDVTCVPPASADRTLTVEFGLSAWMPNEEFVTVASEIEIPAGSQGVSRILSVPQLSSAQHFSLRVWEDGVPIDDLSVEGRSINAGGYFGSDGGGPRILFVASTPVDVSGFNMVGRIPGNNNAAGGRTADVMSFDQRSPAEVPENWINYSGLDLIFISLAEARDLSGKRPGAWQAMRAWTRSGGNLCVFGAGSDWHALEEIEQLLGCPATEKESAGEHRGWEAPSRLVFESQVVQGVMTAPVGAPLDPNVPQTTVSIKKPVAPKVAPFVWKPAGFGRVVAVAEAQPFPGQSATWRWLVESLGPARTEWTTRQGTAPDQGNENFNDFLIADVGLPPIRTYQVLITLFVIAIGPVNYWILRRHGRLHLFLFTVPAAALATSAGLLAYALVADGLESRLRARSVTHLDQRAGEAVRLARLSYYMGLAPSGGLEFPDDTAIAPLQLTAADGPLRGRNRRLVWRDGQHLTRGWIRSRMPTQYVTTRASKTRQELIVVPTGNAAGATVTNRLGVHVKQLLVCDEGGKLHRGEQIAPDEQKALDWLATADQIAAAAEKFLRELSENRPALPDTMIGTGSTDRWFFFIGRRSHRYHPSASVETSESLLEAELARIAAEVASRSLKPRSYVAIVERPEEIAVGADGLTETQSLHVIEGRW
jgi:hypothetical protein